MLNLIRCEFWKLKRKMFVQLVLAASFLFPIPLTAIIYYLNTAQNKYATKAAAFDAPVAIRNRFWYVATSSLHFRNCCSTPLFYGAR